MFHFTHVAVEYDVDAASEDDPYPGVLVRATVNNPGLCERALRG